MRLFLPVILIVVVTLVGYAVLVTSKPTPAATTPAAATPALATPAAAAPAGAAAPAATPAPANPAPANPATAQVAPAPTTPAVGAVAPITGMQARMWPPYQPAPIGGLERDASGKVTTPFEMQVEFTSVGAGVARLALSREFDSITAQKKNEVLQEALVREVPYSDGTVRRVALVPMSMLGVTINGSYVALAGTEQAPVWRQTAPGSFEAVIVDSSGREVVKLVRQFVLEPARHTITLKQSAVNLTEQNLSIAWRQTGAMDLPFGRVTYGGDVRRLRLGVIPGPASNPSGQFVSGSSFTPHDKVVGTLQDTLGITFSEVPVYPTEEYTKGGDQLAWVAATNRYFGVGVFSLPGSQPARADGKPNKVLPLAASVERVVLSRERDIDGKPTAGDTSKLTQNAAFLTVLQSAVVPVAGGKAADFSAGVYAGPVSRAVIGKDPLASAASVDELVLYSMGGPCVFCTFQSITTALRWYLGVLHDYVVFDWALAVIFLVLTVRTILHPVTRWSQTNLQRFGKQMQRLAPKQQAIKDKYGSDPARMREELGRLMAEEKVNYLQALGCLPMFLQTPVWIALYAMINFTYELRHEGAFFGLFQKISGGAWGFLGDLSEPDRLVRLGFGFDLPLMGHIDAINIIPVLLGVVFYIQQKYLSPPSATTLSPEMETQQKIMKVMMVVLFPVMMYNAPAALSLYFVANSSLGILESKLIRKKFDEEEKLREEQEKIMSPAERRKAAAASGKPKGFFARLQETLEQRMAEAERLRQEQEKAKRKGNR